MKTYPVYRAMLFVALDADRSYTLALGFDSTPSTMTQTWWVSDVFFWASVCEDSCMDSPSWVSLGCAMLFLLQLCWCFEPPLRQVNLYMRVLDSG
jgi:hypothetical protein